MAHSEGIKYVLVNGVVVVKDGEPEEDVAPGRPVRAPTKEGDARADVPG